VHFDTGIRLGITIIFCTVHTTQQGRLDVESSMREFAFAFFRVFLPPNVSRGMYNPISFFKETASSCHHSADPAGKLTAACGAR
jgi:hypothetical protein